MHFRPPSIDPGVTAFLWAIGLGAYVYFGMLAVGMTGAFAIVITLLSVVGIWLVVRTRGTSQ